MVRSLFKHSGIYFIGLVLGKTLSVAVFILFARSLLPEKFGDFIFFVMLVQIFTFFADFGLLQWYQKRADTDDKEKLFNLMISSRLTTLLISVVIATVFIYLFPTFSPFASAVFIISLMPEAYLSIFDAYYLEKQQSFKVSLKSVLRSFLLLLGFTVFYKKFSLESAFLVYLASSSLTLLWYFPWHMVKSFVFSSRQEILLTLRSSFSYALLISSSFLYARGDSLVIRYVLSNAALGLYGGAYRYLESLSLMPTALSQNLFPLSAKKEGVSFNQLKKILAITFLLGLSVSFLVFILSDLLILGLLGKPYEQAVPVLKIFSLVLLLFFINAPLATVIQSSKLVKPFLPFGILNTLGNIFLNILFVPLYGIIAAAWIMAVTEITGLFINLYFLKKLYSESI